MVPSNSDGSCSDIRPPQHSEVTDVTPPPVATMSSIGLAILSSGALYSVNAAAQRGPLHVVCREVVRALVRRGRRRQIAVPAMHVRPRRMQIDIPVELGGESLEQAQPGRWT